MEVYGRLNPRRCAERIGALVKDWFPAAFTDTGSPLPSSPAFQHHFLGLCNWADWIGSNKRWFPFLDEPRDSYIEDARRQAKNAINAIGLELLGQRRGFVGMPEFGELFDIPGSPGPNAIQETAQRMPTDQRLVIIESETGSGKTEAALWRFAHLYEQRLVDGLYFALPTRTAAVQIHRRVKRFIGKLLSHYRPSVVLAVPGYEAAPDENGVRLPDYDFSAAGERDDDRPWAAEHPKRFLAAQVAVGTVDQAMLSVLPVKNAHMRAACLARNLLVIDEVHASDTYMSAILRALLDAHVGAGGYALLMSATLGSAARLRWLFRRCRDSELPRLSLHDAIETDYPAVTTTGNSKEEVVVRAGENNQEKRVRVAAMPRMHDFDGTAHHALTAARAGAKVLVVRNTVDYAIKTQQAIEQLAGPDDAKLLFAVRDVPTLHHGRFAPGDRALLDERVDDLLGKGRQPGGQVVIGTQTLEQSLDIDADLLVTDLCPVDVLLQRIGRLHRHRRNDTHRPNGYGTPACRVLTPPDNDLSSLLENTPTANGLGTHGRVYEDLRILEATRRLIDEYPQWRIPEMNRRLVERATHRQALDQITQEMGDDWMAHANEVDGAQLADRATGRGAVVSRDLTFLDNIAFPGNEERMRTRLGDDRIEVALDPPQTSSFDGSRMIATLALPLRWLPSKGVPEQSAPTPSADGFEFAIGERRFRYDRWGLRRL